jgi:hypothetical protein
MRPPVAAGWFIKENPDESLVFCAVGEGLDSLPL